MANNTKKVVVKFHNYTKYFLKIRKNKQLKLITKFL